MFSAEFKQEMQKEIEKELSMRNEMRHRIVKHDSMTLDRKGAAEGLKYLLSERESLSASNSTSTSSSIASRQKEKEPAEPISTPATPKVDNASFSKLPGTPESSSIFNRGLRPTTSTSETLLGLGGLAPSGGYVLRAMPRGSAGWTATAASARGSPSISTKFFRRLASNLDAYDNNNNDDDIDNDIDGL